MTASLIESTAAADTAGLFWLLLRPPLRKTILDHISDFPYGVHVVVLNPTSEMFTELLEFIGERLAVIIKPIHFPNSARFPMLRLFAVVVSEATALARIIDPTIPILTRHDTSRESELSFEMTNQEETDRKRDIARRH